MSLETQKGSDQRKHAQASELIFMWQHYFPFHQQNIEFSQLGLHESSQRHRPFHKTLKNIFSSSVIIQIKVCNHIVF